MEHALDSAALVHLHKASVPVSTSGTFARNALVARRTALVAALDRFCAMADDVATAADLITGAIQGGGRILVAGNGGSAAEAQHFATELVGRFKREREAFAAIALTADTAILTAVANDYGFAEVFARQVAAYGRPGDLLLLFSTSGRSENVLRAARAASERGITVVALTGGQPNRLAAAADLAIRVPASETTLVQELHTVALHVICDIVEAALTDDAAPEVHVG